MGRLGSLFSSGALEKRNQKQSLFLVSSPVEMMVAASTGGHGGAAMGAAGEGDGRRRAATESAEVVGRSD
jgi:hypothetical protein